MRKLALCVILGSAALLIGCTDRNGAYNALADAGYEQIEITGYRPFSCGQDDAVKTGFRAVGPTGREVRGTVCSGLLFKDSTIRISR